MHLLVVTRGADRPELQSLENDLSYGGKLAVALKSPPPASGYQVTWWEIFTIYVVSKPADAVLGRTYKALIDYVIGQVREWYQKTRQDHVHKRPLQVTIRSRIGRALRAVRMSEEGERDVTSESRGALAPPPPEEDFERRLEEPKNYDSKLSKAKVRATVLFCDIADFSALLGRQAMSVHRWMRACREEWESIVAAQGGALIYSHRDNLAAHFVGNRDQQEHVERAVAAALSIAAVPARSGHRRLAKVRIRIGIATGISSDYQLLSRRGSSPVLRAAAALSTTSRDSILIDAETRRGLNNGVFRLEYLGVKETGGDRRKRRVWRLTAATPAGVRVIRPRSDT